MGNSLKYSKLRNIVVCKEEYKWIATDGDNYGILVKIYKNKKEIYANRIEGGTITPGEIALAVKKIEGFSLKEEDKVYISAVKKKFEL